ncbi:type II toxin-antitoxin system VapC family toxin [Sphingomonas sp. Mn802worker]|uniref:type II toxin-antitoxin system VapC family toxin n=1 Tax=Sphingomonas sp. Mn802worker TaxID=629773 RepID=UPI000364CA9E|nr:type II toxin-antitoxin system VapC family toxin [Sphingomonas sp. Mn802worker]
MKITADTNVLVRALTADDQVQSPIAMRTLSKATLVALPIVALAETVWVLNRAHKWKGPQIAAALRLLLNDPRVKTEWPLVEAGLDLLDRGGDFADAVIEADGRRLGAETLATFDEQAARLLADTGASVTRPV